MSSPYEQIRYERSDSVLTLTLNRPERMNTFTPMMADELHDAFDRADADDAIRAVVLTGAGRCFCAGADVSGGGDRFDYPDGPAHRDIGGKLTLRMFTLLKPLIVAFNGPAAGVGATMALPADIRLASSRARFGFVFSRIGIVPEAASSWFLPKIVGVGQAMEWVLTGRTFDAQEALAGGLVRSVHEPSELLPAAYDLAREIAENTAPVSVAMARQMLWRMAGAADPMLAHRLDSRALRERGATADVREGIDAFLQKRRPIFTERVSADLPDFISWRRSDEFEPWTVEP
jgi:enoyl-CoA hydratase/carnithine racemase